MNWQLAGFDLEYGSTRPMPPITVEGWQIAEQRIRKVAEAYHVRFVEPQEVAVWQTERPAKRSIF